MRVEQVQPRGFFHYDRHPGAVLIEYNANNVAPHAQTDRVVDIADQGYKYLLSGILLFVRRTAAASTPGIVCLRVYAHTSTRDIEIARVWIESNVVGDRDILHYPIQHFYEYPWGIRITSQDSSVGGTVSYLANCLVTRFGKVE